MSAITAIVGGCVLEPKQEIGAVKDHPNPGRVGPLIYWSCLKTFVSSPVVVYDFNKGRSSGFGNIEIFWIVTSSFRPRSDWALLNPPLVSPNEIGIPSVQHDTK